MSEAVQNYLKSVLGVKEWISPVAGSLSRYAVVYSPFDMTAPEQAIATKMLVAAQLGEPLFTCEGKIDDLIGEGKAEYVLGIAFGVTPFRKLNKPWLELPAISKFLDTSDTVQLAKNKKHAWSMLQNFKSQLD